MLPSSSLTSLYPDIWTGILQYISDDDLGRLTLINPALSSTIRRVARNLPIHWKSGFVDLERCISSSSRFKNLENFSILAFDTIIHTKSPLQVPKLPRTLVSLHLSFYDAFNGFFHYENLDELLPHLQHLRINCTSESLTRPLYEIVFPSKLLSLNFSCWSAFQAPRLDFRATDLLRLPPSINTLELRGCRLFDEAITPSYFPASLTKFFIDGRCSLSLLQLPRSINELSIGLRHTANPIKSNSNHPIAFPWRAYFPGLTKLMFCPEVSNGCAHQLLDPDCLREDPEFASLYELMDGSNIGMARTSEAPIAAFSVGYTSLRICDVGSWSPEPPFEEEKTFLGLLPQMTSLQQLHLNTIIIPQNISMLTNLHTLYLRAQPTEIAFPPSLTQLDVRGCELSRLPPTLTSLTVNSITGPHNEFPPKLRTLVMYEHMLTQTVADALPLSIEHLSIGFAQLAAEGTDHPLNEDLSPSCGSEGRECDRAWRSIAKRLTRLKSLSIIDSQGCPTMALEPLSSAVFESLELNGTGSSTMIPWLSTLFDGRNDSGRPEIFPKSLHTVQIHTWSDGGVPLSLIPMLPRSLTDFQTSHMCHKKLLPNFPFNKELAETQFLEHLPPKLKRLIWSDGFGSVGTSVEMESSSLQYWPSSLEILALSSELTINIPGISSKNRDAYMTRLRELLPPNLSQLKYSSNM